MNETKITIDDIADVVQKILKAEYAVQMLRQRQATAADLLHFAVCARALDKAVDAAKQLLNEREGNIAKAKP